MKKSARSARKPPAKAKKAAKPRVTAVPPGFHSLTPQISVRDAVRAIDFYTRAFGARQVMRMDAPDGKVMHAELRIGDSLFFLNEEMPDMGCRRSPQTLGGSTGGMHIYVSNVDAAFKRAVDAGAQASMPVSDMFWGDRYGKVTDPFGHEWGLATHKETLTPAQTRKRAEAFFKEMAQHG